MKFLLNDFLQLYRQPCSLSAGISGKYPSASTAKDKAAKPRFEGSRASNLHLKASRQNCGLTKPPVGLDKVAVQGRTRICIKYEHSRMVAR
jgi:hypothetical protein